MYINAYKETYDNLYLTKGQDVLPMISFEIEKILNKKDVCKTARDFLPRLKEIKQLTERYEGNDDVASFIRELKEYNHLETNDFKFIIEKNPNNHVWVNIEYFYYDTISLNDVVYTSVIEHIDNID